MIERVLLFGGPFDGEYLDVDAHREYVTLVWDRQPSPLYPPPATRTELCGYRRVDRHTFTHCRVQTKLDERAGDLAFPDQQEDRRDDRNA